MSDRFFVLVTGASRGFGRCVAEEFVRKIAPLNPVDLVLVARSAAGLQSAASSVYEMARSFPNCKEVVVRQVVLDLGDLEPLEDRLDEMLSGIGDLCDFV